MGGGIFVRVCFCDFGWDACPLEVYSLDGSRGTHLSQVTRVCHHNLEGNVQPDAILTRCLPADTSPDASRTQVPKCLLCYWTTLICFPAYASASLLFSNRKFF